MTTKDKKTADNVIEIPHQEQTVNVNTVNIPIVAKKETVEKKPQWEIKDRHYYLTGNKSPLTYVIPTRHKINKPLLWFDPVTNEQREIRYATNMPSPLRDEQKGEATLGHVLFRNGHLFVPKEYQALQKLLSIYHPYLNKRYAEVDTVMEATDQLETIELEIDALNLAKAIDIDMAEAIMRVENGSNVSSMSSKEIKRDLLLFAKRNPRLFIDLANDENVQLRNFAIKATEANIVKLSQDQRYFTWASNGKKLMTVPFDENPYSAFAAFLQTDEGVEIYKSIEKKFQ
jgi:hypothetical protein